MLCLICVPVTVLKNISDSDIYTLPRHSSYIAGRAVLEMHFRHACFHSTRTVNRARTKFHQLDLILLGGKFLLWGEISTVYRRQYHPFLLCTHKPLCPHINTKNKPYLNPNTYLHTFTYLTYSFMYSSVHPTFCPTIELWDYLFIHLSSLQCIGPSMKKKLSGNIWMFKSRYIGTLGTLHLHISPIYKPQFQNFFSQINLAIYWISSGLERSHESV